MKVIDCTGLLCPKPIIETKRAIKANKSGEILKVIIDNDISLGNLKKFLTDNGFQVNYQEENGKHSLTFTLSDEPLVKVNPKEYCEIPSQKSNIGSYIVVLSSNCLGSGSEELGELLMKGFLSTIIELETLPQEVICYNSGIKLAIRGVPTAVNLRILGDQGVRITLCGTCVDYYGVKDELEMGELSNMYYITQRLTSGIYIVKP